MVILFLQDNKNQNAPFMQGEYSQPFLKPPHLEQPISTLLLSESTMAFGRVLGSDNDGNFKGSFMLTLKEGYVLRKKEFVLIYMFMIFRITEPEIPPINLHNSI